VLAIALLPAALLFQAVFHATIDQVGILRILLLCLTASIGYFIFGLSLIVVTALVRFLFRLELSEGTYPMFSLGSVRWAITNALQLLIWITFGDFILLTPFASLVYRLMGAKLGRNVQINSKFCGDLSLLEIGDGSVIGGHATVIAHSFERKGLVLKKVRIGRQVVVGLNAIVLWLPPERLCLNIPKYKPVPFLWRATRIRRGIQRN